MSSSSSSSSSVTAQKNGAVVGSESTAAGASSSSTSLSASSSIFIRRDKHQKSQNDDSSFVARDRDRGGGRKESLIDDDADRTTLTIDDGKEEDQALASSSSSSEKVQVQVQVLQKEQEQQNPTSLTTTASTTTTAAAAATTITAFKTATAKKKKAAIPALKFSSRFKEKTYERFINMSRKKRKFSNSSNNNNNNSNNSNSNSNNNNNNVSSSSTSSFNSRNLKRKTSNSSLPASAASITSNMAVAVSSAPASASASGIAVAAANSPLSTSKSSSSSPPSSSPSSQPLVIDLLSSSSGDDDEDSSDDEDNKKTIIVVEVGVGSKKSTKAAVISSPYSSEDDDDDDDDINEAVRRSLLDQQHLKQQQQQHQCTSSTPKTTATATNDSPSSSELDSDSDSDAESESVAKKVNNKNLNTFKQFFKDCENNSNSNSKYSESTKCDNTNKVDADADADADAADDDDDDEKIDVVVVGEESKQRYTTEQQQQQKPKAITSVAATSSKDDDEEEEVKQPWKEFQQNLKKRRNEILNPTTTKQQDRSTSTLASTSTMVAASASAAASAAAAAAATSSVTTATVKTGASTGDDDDDDVGIAEARGSRLAVASATSVVPVAAVPVADLLAVASSATSVVPVAAVPVAEHQPITVGGRRSPPPGRTLPAYGCASDQRQTVLDPFTVESNLLDELIRKKEMSAEVAKAEALEKRQQIEDMKRRACAVRLRAEKLREQHRLMKLKFEAAKSRNDENDRRIAAKKRDSENLKILAAKRAKVSRLTRDEEAHAADVAAHSDSITSSDRRERKNIDYCDNENNGDVGGVISNNMHNFDKKDDKVEISDDEVSPLPTGEGMPKDDDAGGGDNNDDDKGVLKIPLKSLVIDQDVYFKPNFRRQPTAEYNSNTNNIVIRFTYFGVLYPLVCKIAINMDHVDEKGCWTVYDNNDITVTTDFKNGFMFIRVAEDEIMNLHETMKKGGHRNIMLEFENNRHLIKLLKMYNINGIGTKTLPIQYTPSEVESAIGSYNPYKSPYKNTIRLDYLSKSIHCLLRHYQINKRKERVYENIQTKDGDDDNGIAATTEEPSPKKPRMIASNSTDNEDKALADHSLLDFSIADGKEKQEASTTTTNPITSTVVDDVCLPSNSGDDDDVPKNAAPMTMMDITVDTEGKRKEAPPPNDSNNTSTTSSGEDNNNNESFLSIRGNDVTGEGNDGIVTNDSGVFVDNNTVNDSQEKETLLVIDEQRTTGSSVGRFADIYATTIRDVVNTIVDTVSHPCEQRQRHLETTEGSDDEDNDGPNNKASPSTNNDDEVVPLELVNENDDVPLKKNIIDSKMKNYHLLALPMICLTGILLHTGLFTYIPMSAIVTKVVITLFRFIVMGLFLLPFGRWGVVEYPIRIVSYVVLLVAVASYEVSSRTKYTFDGQFYYIMGPIICIAGWVLLLFLKGMLGELRHVLPLPIVGMLVVSSIDSISSSLDIITTSLVENQVDELVPPFGNNTTHYEFGNELFIHAIQESAMMPLNMIRDLLIMAILGMIGGCFLGGSKPIGTDIGCQMKIIILMAVCTLSTILLNYVAMMELVLFSEQQVLCTARFTKNHARSMIEVLVDALAAK